MFLVAPVPFTHSHSFIAVPLHKLCRIAIAAGLCKGIVTHNEDIAHHSTEVTDSYFSNQDIENALV